MAAADSTPGDRLRPEDVTTADVAALLDFLARCDVGGGTWCATWEVRAVLAGQPPPRRYSTP
jgi:hypothetical protein